MTDPDKQPDPLTPSEEGEPAGQVSREGTRPAGPQPFNSQPANAGPVNTRPSSEPSLPPADSNTPDWVQSMTQPGMTQSGVTPPSSPAPANPQPGKLSEAEREASSLASEPFAGTSLPGAQPGRVNPNQPDFSPTVPSLGAQPGAGDPQPGGQPGAGQPSGTPGWGSGANWNVGANPTTPQTPPSPGGFNPGMSAPGSFTPGMVAAPGSKKIAAGLLAIFLGSLGVHKFYLGMNTPGFILLGATLFGAIFFWLIFPIIFIWAAGIIGLVEGIIYLTKTDQQFHQEYEIGKKQWF